MRTAIAAIAVLVFIISWFVYQGFAEYSTSPDSSVSLCYTENWSAAKYMVLSQTFPDGGGHQFSYSLSSDPTTAGSQEMYDFVPVKWEVTGNVSFKSE
ncbi:MAG: hypothetical protein WC335_04645 [Candidatus Omnitrophota bacterium]|jgi:hypothetical protein